LNSENYLRFEDSRAERLNRRQKTCFMFGVNLARSDLLPEVLKKISVFWYITPSTQIYKYKRFGGPYYFHLHSSTFFLGLL
jgi:hypothetical protein